MLKFKALNTRTNGIPKTSLETSLVWQNYNVLLGHIGGTQYIDAALSYKYCRLHGLSAGHTGELCKNG